MGLPKKYRITKESDFNNVFKRGRKIVTPYFIFLYQFKEGVEHPRFGIVASKKVGKAVERNRAKRMIREAIRNELENINKPYEAVIICRGNILNAKLDDIRARILSIREIRTVKD